MKLFKDKTYPILPIVNGHTQRVYADYHANSFTADENCAVVHYTSAESCVREINVTESSVSLHE